MQEGYIKKLTRLSQCLNAKTGFVHFWSEYQSLLYWIFMFQIVHFQKILEGQCLNSIMLTAPLYILLASNLTIKWMNPEAQKRRYKEDTSIFGFIGIIIMRCKIVCRWFNIPSWIGSPFLFVCQCMVEFMQKNPLSQTCKSHKWKTKFVGTNTISKSEIILLSN